MDNIPPSIFNDVIGPVMRGPSSSHTAASVRIGRLARQILDDAPENVLVEFDPGGSLATTYHSQGSDIGLAAGLLGWDITNTNLSQSLREAKKKGIKIEFMIVPYQSEHPNTYRLTLSGKSGVRVRILAVSYGGGIIEIQSVDDFPVRIRGDYHEVMINVTGKADKPGNEFRILPYQTGSIESVEGTYSENRGLVLIKMTRSPEPEWLKGLARHKQTERIICLDPVMPVLSSKSIKVPFRTIAEVKALVKARTLNLSDAAIQYECKRSSFPEEKVFGMMREIVDLLMRSISEGLEGTSYSERILGYQSGAFVKAIDQGNLLRTPLLNKVIACNMAVMEMKSSMGLIVAAPTAGSCATLPGTLIPTAEMLNLGIDEITKAFFAAALIGLFIADGSTFAAEECGCQAECGSASGMAAAGLVQLMGGTVDQGLKAASLALQNVIGMVCDPVANRVEVPCLGKNIMASVNAITSANMALAGMEQVIPLEEVITAMDEAGRSLPRELRCTGLGGLSLTPTSKKIQEDLTSNYS